jgi:hypothetical protein
MPALNATKQSYKTDSIPLSPQRLINLYYENAPREGKSEGVRYGTSGLKVWADVANDRIWGIHKMGDNLYAVVGDNVYRISSGTTATLLGSIGTVANVVIMADNGVDVIILKEEGDAWLADESSLTQITDASYQSASSVTVLDGYAIFSKLDSNQFFISSLLDAATYDATEIASAEESPDKIVAVFAHRGQLWVFGEESIEIFYNSGALDFPFLPLQQAAMSRGCAAKRSIAQEDNTLFWLGEDRIIYRAEGYAPKRISNFGIEDALQDYAVVSDAEAFAYTERGHKFYALTFPTEGVTWVYDMATQLWHERQSLDKGRWRATGHSFFNGLNLVGDFEDGKIYEVDKKTYTENSTTIQRIMITPTLNEEDKRITFNRVFVDFDKGVGLVTGQGSNPQVALSFSDDGGFTYGPELWRDIGEIGEYKRRGALWHTLGQSRERVFKILVSDPVRVAIKDAYAKVRIDSD